MAHAAGATCVNAGTPRCDNPQDLSGSAGMAAPLIQNTYVLNDIKVQVRASSAADWNVSTLRDYQLSYDQTGPGQIRDPATGLLESVAGHLMLTQITEIGTDAGQLPARAFAYQAITNFYEDDANYAASSAYCPGWVPNGDLCSQSYGGNSYFLASAANGLGLSQSFGWSLARNNTYVGRTDPLYCNTTTANNCTLADNQNWSRVVLTSESDATAGSANASTTTYSYALANFVAQTCPQCTVGYTWGDQKDGDYSDYYNGKFMGFAKVTVTKPDLSVEIHYYHSTLGWGVYDCSQVSCTADGGHTPRTYCFNACNPDAWWLSATPAQTGRLTTNALHGHEQEADFYDKRWRATDPLVLLRQSTTSYTPNAGSAGCRPSGVPATQPTSWGTWDSQLVSELDPSNPVAGCEVQPLTVTTSTYDGTNPTTVPQSTTTYTYDAYGRVISEKLTSTNGAGGSPTTIFHKPTYMTADSVSGTAPPGLCVDPSRCHYLIDFATFNDTEDSAGTMQACTYTSYDSSFYAEITQVDRYTDCSRRDSSHQITTSYAYDSSGNLVATDDPDANANQSSHLGCTLGGLTKYSRCTAYDGFNALPISSTVSVSSSQTLATGTQYQPSVGLSQWPASTTDANGQTTSYGYDGLGRLTSLTVPPIGSQSGQQTISSTAYSGWCAGTAANVPCVEVDQNQRPGSEAGGTYVPLTAARICDTRSGSGTPCAGRTLAANATLNLQVAGQGGVPSVGAAAVLFNVTVTNTSAIGNLTIYPTGSGQPSTSNVNFAAGQTIANLVQVPLGSSGQVAFTSVGSATDVIVDVQGYVAQIVSGTAGLMSPLSPSSRICDTRGGSGSPCAGRTIGANGSLTIQVTGQGGVPTSGVQAVVMNVAVTNTAASGSMTVYPTGQAVPSTSNMNWPAGQTLSNRVVVPVGTGGQVTIANGSGGSTDVIVDVFAWTTDGSNPSASGSEYGALIGSRVCDTRAGSGTQCAGQTIQANTTLTIQVAGLAGVPSRASANPPTAVDVNVAVTGASVGGSLTIYPSQAPRPSTSDLNFTAGQTVANRDVAAALGSDGRLAIANLGGSPVDVIIDVAGYYAPGPAGMAISRAFYDGWGHLVETRSFATNNQDVVRYAAYDVSGRLAFQSVPFFVPAYEGPPGFPAYYLPDTRAGTSTLYEGLGRVTSTTDALSNTTSYTISTACNVAGTGDTACYEQTVTIDPLAHKRLSLVDAFGRTAYVQRFTGPSAGAYSLYATTKYTHDYQGNLIRILHPDGSSATSFVYDMAGRKTAMTDPDSGQWSYTYDQDGNLTTSVDGRANATGTVNIAYDGLDRPLSRSTPATTPATTYATETYDAGTNGKGRLTSESFSGLSPNSLSGSATYSYDTRGEQTNRTLTVTTGGCAAGCLVGTTYDDAGRTVAQTYPTGEVVTNTYNSAGWLTGLSTLQGTTTTTLLSNAGYTQGTGQFGGPAGRITLASLGGGLYQYSATYDALLRATDLRFTNAAGTTTFFDQGRTFDGFGNVTSAATTLPNVIDNQVFCYDEQDRLTWAGSSNTPPCTGAPISGSTSPYTQAFAYDALGRLTSGPAASNTYTYGDSSHLHAATAIAGVNWLASYDAGGNMTCRATSGTSACGGAQLSFDAEGRLNSWQSSPTNPTSVANFLYDSQGNRVAQQVTTNGTVTTTIYVDNTEQISTTGSSTTATTYYYANGNRIGLAVNGTFSFLASDGLGSTDMALSGTTATVTATQLYWPYGGGGANTRYSTGTMPTDYGLTGQHADAATGLDYYNARYYDPMAGQFASADSVLNGNGYDVFGLSRYAYVEGNPLARTDPSGHCFLVCAAIGFVAGAAIVYGAQVVGNLQQGKGLNSFTDVNKTNILLGGVAGAVILGTLGLAAPTVVGLVAGGGATSTGAGLGTAATATAAAAKRLGEIVADAEPVAGRAVAAGDRAGGLVRAGTTDAAAVRGLSKLGGIFSSEENGAGGTLWTSVGDISQNDVAPLVNSGMYRGNVNIISGVHGLVDGSTLIDASIYDADVASFGNLPGVTVYNLPGMASGQITDLLNGEGTTIGAFCNSGACLARFR